MQTKPGNTAAAFFLIGALSGCAHLDGNRSFASSPNAQSKQNSADAEGHVKRGIHFFQKGKFDDAIKEFNEILRTYPEAVDIYYYRGLAISLKGEPDKAISDFDEAIKLDPKDAAYYHARGIDRARTKHFKDAVDDFKEAVDLDPNFVGAYSALAALRATSYDADIRNGLEAVQAATKACELTKWKISQHIDRLAAAYAETGDWDKAIAFEKRALKVGAVTREDHNRIIISLTLYEHHLQSLDPTIFE